MAGNELVTEKVTLLILLNNDGMIKELDEINMILYHEFGLHHFTLF